MKRAVIIHGMPSKAEYENTDGDSQSNSHWLPWLQQQLCARNILAQTPEMPTPYAPDYATWREEFERYAVDEETVLVGHSWGGGFLLRWLYEHPNRRIAKLVLVAPWLDPDRDYGELFDFALPRDLGSRTMYGIEYLYSSSDRRPMLETLVRVKRDVDNVTYHDFPTYRHFTFKHMQTHEFPELLELSLF